LTSGFTQFFKSFFVLYNIMSRYVLFLILGEWQFAPLQMCLIASFAGAKVRRFFKLANFFESFFKKIFNVYTTN